ncbi:MAG: hypothetical protein LBN34_05215 [Clostridiales Family XIII bacterium]|jgi:hypothetical protein|nr:hypothetical protein [Clostridiales Family XIII bacterium]
MNDKVLVIKERLHKLQQWIFDPKKPLHTIIPIVLCVAIVAGIIFIARSLGVYSVNEPIYRYDTGARIDYTGRTTFTTDEKSGDPLLKNHGDTVKLDHAPIYFTDDDKKLLLPAQMAAVFPEVKKNGRTGVNMEIVKEGRKLTANVRNNDVDVTEAFLFDGNNTYVFLKPMKISIGLEEIDLPAFSYVYVYYNLRVEIYSPDESVNVVMQTGDTPVIALSKDNSYQIDLSKDILHVKDGEILLITDPSVLNYVTASMGKK